MKTARIRLLARLVSVFLNRSDINDTYTESNHMGQVRSWLRPVGSTNRRMVAGEK